MILRREIFSKDGVFGSLRTETDEEICKTLEHAYASFGKKYRAKIPTGEFTCVRGIHRLSKGIPFETFEVSGIRGHSGIIFHPGNFNRDSDGCVLVGEEVRNQALFRSRVAFVGLMHRLNTVESFVLKVVGG